MSDGTNETTHPARTGSQEQVETAARECATRASYDAIAETYTDWISAELTAKPHDRAVLGAFSELVLSTGHSETLEI
ncbi:MAG: class I SAM-dependent methyltransferase, partial [Brevibacterium aurantiacum]